MFDGFPNRTEARPASPKLTPYSAIFCQQVLALRILPNTPPISISRNRMKTNILDIWYEKIANMPDGQVQKQRADAMKHLPQIFLKAES